MLCLTLALLALLPGCQTSTDEPGVSPATPASPATYPDLASVPPRPRLSYTVEQRREIGDQLVADLENARYRRGELAYATGRADAPPPAPAAAAQAPPAPVEAGQPALPPAPATPAGDGAIARAYVDSSLNASSDNGKLRKFMRRLERPVPDPAGPATLGEALSLTGGGADPAPMAPEAPSASSSSVAPAAGEPPGDAPQPGALGRFGSYLGGILGLDAGQEERASAVKAEAAEVARAEPAEAQPTAMPAPPPAAAQPAAMPAPPPATVAAIAKPPTPKHMLAPGSVAARVPFSPKTASLAPGAETQLGRAVELAHAANTRLRIVAPASPPALAIDRARTVAVGLMRLGASADQLDLSTGGVGEEVIVYLAPRRT